MRKFLLPWLVIFFTACSPLVTTTQRPSPQAITVAYTATLRSWVEILNRCASHHPEVALIAQETSLSDPIFQNADITLWLGEPPQGISGFATSLGTDEIVVIAGREVDIQNLSQKQLRQIYSDPDSPYQTWTYGDGNELRLIFDQVILDAAPLKPESFLSPNPAAMVEAIQDNPLAIGYIPDSWLTKDVNRISLERDLQAAFERPILALTKKEPLGPLQSYLACVQDLTP